MTDEEKKVIKEIEAQRVIASKAWREYQKASDKLDTLESNWRARFWEAPC